MVKIQQLEVENLKRIKACTITPAESGLTVIGGKNGQGKTSALDAIAWALGGERYRPSNAQREDSVIPPRLKVVLSNGITVERIGKNSALKVTDQVGKKSGQQLLNEFMSQLAIDLPRFMQASGKEKANALLQIIGVGDKLFALEKTESNLYNERLAIGRISDQKKKFAQEMPSFDGVPDIPVGASDLIRQQQDILAKNGENQRLRLRAADLEERKQQLRRQLDDLQELYATVCRDCDIAASDATDLQDESTEELERSLMKIDEVNRKVRSNLDKNKAEDDAKMYQEQYDNLTAQINQVRDNRIKLLDSAEMPLPGLSVEDGELTYNGQKWDCMSGAEQLMVSTAVARAINPACGFVLLDKLEQMDLDTLRQFGEWLEQEGLQVIATRVSTGDECSIIIEDGCTPEEITREQVITPPAWKGTSK